MLDNIRVRAGEIAPAVFRLLLGGVLFGRQRVAALDDMQQQGGGEAVLLAQAAGLPGDVLRGDVRQPADALHAVVAAQPLGPQSGQVGGFQRADQLCSARPAQLIALDPGAI